MMKALDSIGLPYTVSLSSIYYIALSFKVTLSPCQVPHGAYFILADASAIKIPEDFEYTPFVAKQHKDFKTAYFLAKTCDVVW